jgi:hypothetical protein
MRAFVLLALLVCASAARGADYVDPDTGMILPLRIPGARICVFKPAHLYDSEQCEGVDLDAGRRLLTPRIGMAALVRWSTWSAVLSVSAVPRPAGAPFDAHAMRQLLVKADEAAHNGGRPGNSRGLTPGAPLDTSSLGSVSVARFVTDVSPGRGEPGAPDRLLTYGVGAPGLLYVLTFATHEAHLAKVVPAADALVHGIQLPEQRRPAPAKPGAPSPAQGASPPAPAARAEIPVFLWLIALGAVVVVTVLVRGARRERREQRRRRAERSGGTGEPR